MFSGFPTMSGHFGLDNINTHTKTHRVDTPKVRSCGIRAGADLCASMEATGRLMLCVARYSCSSLAVTRPDFTPSRFKATKSRSAFLCRAELLEDREGVCQLEMAEKRKREETLKNSSVGNSHFSHNKDPDKQCISSEKYLDVT